VACATPSLRLERHSSGGLRGYRFPAEIITYAIWLYHRFALSHRDVEALLAERGIQVRYEAIRLRCRTFGHCW